MITLEMWKKENIGVIKENIESILSFIKEDKNKKSIKIFFIEYEYEYEFDKYKKFFIFNKDKYEYEEIILKYNNKNINKNINNILSITNNNNKYLLSFEIKNNKKIQNIQNVDVNDENIIINKKELKEPKILSSDIVEEFNKKLKIKN